MVDKSEDIVLNNIAAKTCSPEAICLGMVTLDARPYYCLTDLSRSSSHDMGALIEFTRMNLSFQTFPKTTDALSKVTGGEGVMDNC
jgi:hypothetical protein